MSSVTLWGVASDLNKIVSRNLKYFMGQEGCSYRTPNALGVAARVSPNTVRNYLDPSKRTVTADKPDGYPRLDILGDLADKLNCEVWELLHPDIDRSQRERFHYQNMLKAAREEDRSVPPVKRRA